MTTDDGARRGATHRGRQLALDLTRDPSYDREEYLLSASNAEAHAMVERWPDWPGRVLLLLGAAGAGKSHLGTIWAARAGAQTIRRGRDLEVLMHHPPIALIEDGDRAGFAEHQLFHLLNLARENAGWLLITARVPPDRWGLATPDLLSRLRLAVAISIKQPDAALLRAVLVKLFSDRQIRIDEDVVHYAALHCEQSLAAIRDFVAAADEEAMASGRRITRPLAMALIERLARDHTVDE